MSALLDDIINLAIDGNQPLPDILRRCLLLGHELKNDQLKAWANAELNGYNSVEELPEYRIIPAFARGNFVGPLYAQMNEYIIPSAVLKKEHQHWAEKVYLRQPISAFADLAKNVDPTKGRITFPWPGNMVVYYQDKIAGNGFICHQAWQEISSSTLVELVDTVRNRTLNIALQIKDEVGTSYTELHRIGSTEAVKIQHIVFQNIGNTNVSLDQSRVDASGQSTNINLIDRKALDAALIKAGLDKSDLEGLTHAIKSDGDKPATNVGQWIKDKAPKVLVGGLKIGASIGIEILTTLIKQHYGLTP